jgi:hypothetical protein
VNGEPLALLGPIETDTVMPLLATLIGGLLYFLMPLPSRSSAAQPPPFGLGDC